MLCVLAALSAWACSGTDDNDQQASSHGGSGGAGVPVAPGSLSGIWDAIGTRNGGHASSAVITIDADRLAIVTDRERFDAVRTGNTFEITYLGGGRTEQLQASRTSAGTSSLGEFPINLSGGWTVVDTRPDAVGSCESLLADDALTGSCRDVVWLPRILGAFRDGFATGERIAPLDSIFGDLGGAWDIRGTGNGGCLVRFEGQRFQAECSGAGYVDGLLEAEFDGATLSGRSSGGYEFSAQRR